MPVYIARSYDFHTAYIGNRRCIMLTPTEELATLPALKKQIVKIQQIDNVPVVFELTTVSNYRRKSLIENNIPFITDKQVFLPFIGTMLSDDLLKAADKIICHLAGIYPSLNRQLYGN